MDIHEIQRLHAQFAPDSMVIDLPRHIAALPTPGDFPADAAPSARERWAQAGPIARRSVVAVAIAAIVAMAGMGAASLYKTQLGAHNSGHASTPAAPATPATTSALKPDRAESAATREIDATPAHPVAGAPSLSADDFASASSLGLTADQFRASMRKPDPSEAPKTSQALSTESQLAAASPIRRAPSNRGESTQAVPVQVVTPQPAVSTVPQAVAKAAPAAPSSAQPSTTPAQAVAQQAPAAQTQSNAATTTAEEAAKPAHPVRRHISRPRAESGQDSDAAAKPASTNRTGSAEVQMF